MARAIASPRQARRPGARSTTIDNALARPRPSDLDQQASAEHGAIQHSRSVAMVAPSGDDGQTPPGRWGIASAASRDLWLAFGVPLA